MGKFWITGICQRALQIICCSGGLLISTVLLAQNANFSDNTLYIPYIASSDKYYSAELRLLPDTDPPQFELLAAIEMAGTDTLTASSFVNNLLFVPHIEIAATSYWAELIPSSASTFELVSSGINASVARSNQLGINHQPSWTRQLGGASDIGIGADGTVWVIGTDPRPGGFGIYRWTGSSWGRVEGAAVRIDVDPDGSPWIVNDSHQIYRRVDNQWRRLQGDARDIGVGADGSVWAAAGGGIYRWDGAFDWTRSSGSAVRIDVDPLGNPWVTDHTDDVYQLIAGRWVRRPGRARDIGIGADGSVWAIGTSGSNGGHGIYRWSGSNWNRVAGSGRQISVDPQGYPWVLGTGGEIYRGE